MNIAGASAASAGFPPGRGADVTRAAKQGTQLSGRAHLQRIGSAMVLGLTALAATYIGGWAFLVLWTAAAAVVGWEWAALVGARPRAPVLAIGAAALAAAALLIGAGMTAIPLAALVVGAALVLAIDASRQRAWTGFGVLYAAAAFVPVVFLREGPNGVTAVLWLFAVVWGTDIAAFYFGRAFGGPLLMPAVSPNKTWSGAIAGVLAAVVAGAAVLAFFGIALKPAHVAVALAVSVAAQAGDLFESAMKRKFGVKDASQLIPGHGGTMDRLDGFIVAACAALLIGLAHAIGDVATGLVAW
jgi:phosphatidate cytidylyltransferase